MIISTTRVLNNRIQTKQHNVLCIIKNMPQNFFGSKVQLKLAITHGI